MWKSLVILYLNSKMRTMRKYMCAVYRMQSKYSIGVQVALRYNGEGDEIVDCGLRGKDFEIHERNRWDMPGS